MILICFVEYVVEEGFVVFWDYVDGVDDGVGVV